MSTEATRLAILDAAEVLFGEAGYDATSLRTLTARARVNLAAVHYHFGGKEELAKAVLARRIAPINAERLRRLDDAVAPASSRNPTATSILRAFVEPVLLCKDLAAPNAMCRVFGRILVEQPPFLRPFLKQQFGEVARRFVHALAQAVPHLDQDELWWRLHFVIGAMAHTLQNGHLFAAVCDRPAETPDPAELSAQLVAFATGGMTAAGPRSLLPAQEAAP